MKFRFNGKTWIWKPRLWEYMVGGAFLVAGIFCWLYLLMGISILTI